MFRYWEETYSELLVAQYITMVEEIVLDYFQDIEDIGLLHRCVPMGNVFFAVTKVDPESQDGVSDSDSEDDGDAAHGGSTDPLAPSPIEVEKKERAFEKLVEHGFIERQPMAECTNFHGLSSRNVKKYRRLLKILQPTDQTRAILRDYSRYNDDFVRFKSCLLEFTRIQLIKTVINATKILQCPLMQCVDYFIETANNIFENKRFNEANIKLIEAEEKRMYPRIKTTINEASASFKDFVTPVVDRHKESIIEMASKHEYKQFVVPEDGFVEGRSVLDFEREIHEVILLKLTGLIHDDVMKKRDGLDNVYDKLAERLEEMQRKLNGTIPKHDALQFMFQLNYKFDMHKNKFARTFWQNFKKFFLDCLGQIKQFVGVKVNVSDQSWKANVAREMLEMVGADHIARIITSAMLASIEDRHKSFTARLKDVKELYKKSHELGDLQRSTLRKMSPVFGRLQLEAWNIIDGLQFGELTYGARLGSGAQGEVLDCSAVGPNGEECVAKVINIRKEEKINNPKEEKMGKIGLEIHYTRSVSDRESSAPAFELLISKCVVVRSIPNYAEVRSIPYII